MYVFVIFQKCGISMMMYFICSGVTTVTAELLIDFVMRDWPTSPL